MEEKDLKKIWKKANQDDLPTKKYTLEDIQNYRLKKSRQISKSSRLSIHFDIGYKTVVITMLIYLMIAIANQVPYQVVAGVLLLLTATLIFIEFNIINKLRSIKKTDSVIENLKANLLYYKKTHSKFIFISALSNPLFVLSGFLLYYHFTYSEIRFVSPFEDPVMYLFLIAAFAVSFFIQKAFYKKEIKELNESIMDMDDSVIASMKIEESKKSRRLNIIIFSILMLIGILVLLIILKP